MNTLKKESKTNRKKGGSDADEETSMVPEHEQEKEIKTKGRQG